MRIGLYALVAWLLVACGGGSSGNNNIGVAAVVPDVVNQTQAAASAAISAAGLRVGNVTTAGSGTVVAGNVISQNPLAGTTVPIGSNVDLVVSSGPLPAFGLVQPFPNLPAFDKPIFLAAVPAPDTRLVVVEQTGKVRVFASNPGVTTSSTILDVSALITAAGSEQGLLGFAFDPDFANNHFIYVNYTRAADGATMVARYTWDPATPTATSPKIILTVVQPASNHNGGMIAFGLDDYLYVALGDGGSDPTNGQNLDTLLGKILRLDVHPANDAIPYNIPADNPFVGQANHKEEIWAFGFRNPFRFSFDRDNGELWAGDVGQSQREEIDIVEKGQNYGWPTFEGSLPYQNVPLGDGITDTKPLYEYDHGLGCAIIGGYVYRGSQLPSLFSRYLYTDFCSGTVWSLDNAGQDNATLATATSPTSFGEDNDGELYVVSQNGRIYQLQ